MTLIFGQAFKNDPV